ncbi:P-loop containing nucleoside triphosphate hydrolase protein [Fomitiporia mediterranea MF3/22]|uniref:P-loop containing nucleoside triphosphate hydrolase protein n=1 Tax=Fomitiporia mediterranea (strain MF3/22) TaxID=694068 RepID=UPI0004408EEF|nr:P-loop containing nucleoside triphosphate hydrolase protein [Fomitiporia mediterranea MF3/22]EJD02560.1 P-loop containing nucleoside triphosphate hydrolase protein [Fomitiporia mediterranea MF3/22]
MSTTKGLKAIAPVPTASDFLDIVLNKTQRKTPTVIHKNFKISRIRNFYMRKVKFTQDSFDEKLGAILTEFPVLDDLHPFLASLMNVLYDKNHYKLALGQLRTCRHLIDQVAKDYVRLLKFGDSLYRCKQLKRAALGRMATIMRRQKDPLAYLEQVRQHIARLPAIDPNTRTLLLCGYPNVGKSSFLNKVTRADVDVQPYAFTTKSLFVGHLDYKYLRWQVIDTPGILDHPLEDMNTIEMQSITALAHLKACVLYFIDPSEQCGYSVQAQCSLFHSIKPLFGGKPVLLVVNKTDICRLDDLPPESRALVDEIVNSEGVKCVQVSCYSEEGVMDVKNAACDALLAHRVETKLKGSKINTVINRIHVAQPKPRDDVERKPFIPKAVSSKKKFDKNDPERRMLERDIEDADGGAGVYIINLKKNYMLESDEWKFDIIPEIMDGKNIADFVDPDIEEKLEALEREEERLAEEGFYDENSDLELGSEDEREAEELQAAQTKRKESQATKKSLKNGARLPRTAGLRTLSDMSESLTKAGYDPSRIQERAALLAKAQGLKRKRAQEEGMDIDEEGDEDGEGDEGDWMDVDGEDRTPQKRAKSNSGAVVLSGRGPRTNRQLAGLRDDAQAAKAIKLRNLGQRERNYQAKAGEADRAIKTKMPKWMYTGKRKMGKTNRR